VTYRIHNSWTSALRRERETGMGYQVVEVSLAKTTQHILVLNGQQALEPKESPSRFRSVGTFQEG